MKYPQNQPSVGAIYDNAPADNPFLAAMPDLLSPQDFLTKIRSTPPFLTNKSNMSSEERRQTLPMLSSFWWN